MESINSLQLEAIFYPKFDNEKQQKSLQGAGSTHHSVRTTMLQALDNSANGVDNVVYLEASLKHSGNLQRILIGR